MLDSRGSIGVDTADLVLHDADVEVIFELWYPFESARDHKLPSTLCQVPRNWPSCDCTVKLLT